VHRVVVVGGGFGGLAAVRALGRAPVDVTLVDRRNFHLFQPLLYQVATGGLSPGDIASPLRAVVKRQRNAHVVLGEMIDLDPLARRVALVDGAVDYDTLVVATGAETYHFGHDEWLGAAPGLKTIEDATEIRRRIFLAFERAEREAEPARRRAELTFVVVGAGPTGVELAGALAEIARETLKHDFRVVDPRDARILLVEGAERVLLAYSEALSARALASLRGLGVECLLGHLVDDIDDHGVVVRDVVSGAVRRIDAHTIVWAAGVRASPVGRLLGERLGADIDRGGRVVVEPDLTVPAHGDVFVIGDLAHVATGEGGTLPGVAPVAMQQGRYVARRVADRLAGRDTPPFRYVDRGSMATIGRGAAVAHLGPLEFGGYPAWLAWLFIHLLYLVGFQNRVLVAVQWGWSYLTWNRGARLITGLSPFPLWGARDEARDASPPDRPHRPC
jgi:NADH dehydrogenase